jgi:Uma2 family endonuclease
MNQLLPPQRQRARLRVEDFMLLHEHGAFTADGKTELLDGEIVQMQAQHRPHSRFKSALTVRLHQAAQALALPYAVLSEVSMALPPHDMPEPDILLTTAPDGDGPVPADSVGLVIEVADSTLDIDLGSKAALYARHGLPEYWVVDVAGARLHRHSQPDGDMWGLRQTFATGTPWPSATIAGLVIDSTDLR